MPENAAAEGGFGRDAPDRPDDNDRGGQREKEVAKAAESFDRAMDNANRPDRAPAAPSETTTVSDDDDDNSIDKLDDRNDTVAGPPEADAPPSSSSPAATDNKTTDESDEHGFLDRVDDTLTAPPTDAEGNARSTSPVSDRISNTGSYSFDEVGTFLGNLVGGPEITPERRQSLANGAGVIEGVIIEATYPKQAVSERLSALQGAAALADAELAVSMEVYERETTAEISDIDERIAEIDRQGISPLDAHIAKERIDLAQERDRLSKSLASPDAVEEELRGGDEKIGMRADTLEMVVTGRENLAKKINEKEAELKSAALPDVTFRNEELQALRDAKEGMLDLGFAYQGLVDQEVKLAAGETVHISRTRPQSWSEFLGSEVVGGMVGFGAGNLAKVPKYVDHLIDAISGTTVSQQLHGQQGEVLEGVVSVRRRDDGVYEITVSEPYNPNATWASKISHYEITVDKSITLTKQLFDGGNLSGRPHTIEGPRPADDLDLRTLTNGNIEIVDGTIRIAPDIREEAERIMLGRPSNP